MNGHTYTHTHTQDNYSNPRCTHARRGLIKAAACKQYSTDSETNKAAAHEQYSTNPETKKAATHKQYCINPETKR